MDDLKKAKGGRQLKSYLLKGKILNKSDAIIAKCYDCMGYYDDTDKDCKIVKCPLYPHMPYREEGPVKVRSMSEDHKTKIREAIKKRGRPKSLK